MKRCWCRFTSTLALSALVLGVCRAQAQDRSSDYIETYQQQALEIYRTSIGFRTATPYGQVPIMANYLAEKFLAGGFADEDVHILPFTQEDGEETAALIVRYKGDGSFREEPILLIAHMDVVEALPQDWERDPFMLVEEDGYFFGRGTSDNKFGMTMLTSTFLRLKAEEFRPSRDLILGFTGDEETTMRSTRGIVTTYRDLTDAEFALNTDAGGGVLDEHGDPVSYLLQAAEKSYATFELTIRNPGGHSAQPRADNAIYELANVLRKIESYRFPVRFNSATQRYFDLASATRTGELGQAMRRFAADPDDEAAADILYDFPAQAGITRTTCIPTMLSAGHADNALPQSATATINCRIFPGIEISEVSDTLLRLGDNPQLEIELADNSAVGLASPLRDDIMDAVQRTVSSLYPNVPIIPIMSAYFTDAAETRAAGIPTYGVSGLFIREEDEFQHGLNERVPVRSFFGALEFWPKLLKDLTGQ